jgi:hypothetical protein
MLVLLVLLQTVTAAAVAATVNNGW